MRQSADEVLYVMHDATVDRTTDGTGAIAEMTSAEIDRLDAGSWFNPAFAGEPVPRLEDFLRRLKGRVKIYCEIKQADAGRVVDMLDGFAFGNDVFVSSFLPTFVTTCAGLHRISGAMCSFILPVR